MMACGAMHEHYEFEVVPAINRKNKAVAAPPKPPFALASYNKAISAVMDQLSSSKGSVESVAMCCLLFVCLECLRGDPQSAAAHLRSGGSILASWVSRNKTIKGCITEPPYSTPSTSDPAWVHTNLIPIFQRLGSHVATAGRITSAEFNSLVKHNLATTDPLLDGFDNIMDARNSLLNLCALASRYVIHLAHNKYDGANTNQEIQGLMGMRQRMLHWDQAYREFLDEADTATRNSRRALVLWIQRRCYNVALGTSLLPAQCAYDSYMEDFAFIVRNGERLYSRTDAIPTLGDAELSTFSLEEGITPACYFVASTCRDPTLRRVAIKLLRQGPARQGIWNALLFARVAERIVEFEEGYGVALTPCSSVAISRTDASRSDDGITALPTPRASSSESTTTAVCDAFHQPAFLNRASTVKTAASIPEAARIHLADIKESPDSDPHRHTVTFMTRPDGLQGSWRTWTEQVVL